MTVLPLLCFTAAARRLRFATIGLLQYIGPSGHFLLVLFVYGEPFSAIHMIAFSAIWAALLIYSADSWHAHRTQS